MTVRRMTAWVAAVAVVLAVLAWSALQERIVMVGRELGPDGSTVVTIRYANFFGTTKEIEKVERQILSTRILLRIRSILVPNHLRRLLGLEPCRWLRPSLAAYRAMSRISLRPLVHRLVMPPAILPQVRALDFAG